MSFRHNIFNLYPGVFCCGQGYGLTSCTVCDAMMPQVTQSLLQMGCYAVSLGDTIGAGTAGSTATLLDAIRAAGVPTKSLAVHFHDTYGQALANTLVALEQVCIWFLFFQVCGDKIRRVIERVDHVENAHCTRSYASDALL